MRISVLGESDHVDRSEWYRASGFYARALLGTPPDLTLKIHMVDGIRGRCGDVSCPDWLTARRFDVRINTRSGKRCSQLRTLAHEMVHVKQIIMGELVLRGRDLVWRESGEGDLSDSPWEEEAYRLERVLYREYSAEDRLTRRPRRVKF